MFDPKPNADVIRENLTPQQVLALISRERAQGHRVNVNRLHDQLVEIEIIYPNRVIEVNPNPSTRYLMA
ncbi:MAG: hypothetical protein R3E89_12285 [Thiolinea sp.]